MFTKGVPFSKNRLFISVSVMFSRWRLDLNAIITHNNDKYQAKSKSNR